MYTTTMQTSLLVTSLLLFIGACSAPAEKNAVKKDEVPTFESISPQVDQPIYAVHLPGELKPYEEVKLHAKVKGFVKKVYAERGDLVKKGQLLALLEAPEITQQYLSAKSEEIKYDQEYIFAQQAYDRLKNAAKTGGAVAEIELDRALSNLNSAKAALEVSKAQSGIPAQMNAYLRITAPFDGVVMDRKTSEGALVGDNTSELFTLAQTAKLRLTVAVPERHSQSVHKGMNVNFSVNSHPGDTFVASLSRSARVIQKEGRALYTEFDVINHSGLLNGGEYAQVQLQLQRSTPTMWVPVSSIVRTQSGNFVLKVDKQSRITRVPVKEGSRIDTLQEIFGTIDSNDTIIKIASEELIEGSEVKLKAIVNN